MSTKTDKQMAAVLTAALVIFLIGPFSITLAQDATVTSQIASIPRTSSSEVMKRPVSLTDGAGHIHQKVSTDSAEAQAFYDQGLAYLHSYVWVEAARSFHEALGHDPQLAMAHLGLAKAYTGATAYKDAFFHHKQAAKLVAQGNVTEKEAKWIALGQGGRVASVAYHDAALQRDPEHFGAHHYLVHSYEGLGLYDKAAEHGKRYADAVLRVPHAQHMYAHVLPVGQVDGSAGATREGRSSAEGILRSRCCSRRRMASRTQHPCDGCRSAAYGKLRRGGQAL